MRHRAIFVDVAPGAIGPERGEFPGDGLGIRDVTAVAADPGPMIHISWGRVPVCHRCPERGPMTRLARQRREEMPGRPAFGHGAVVATDTRRSQAGMIDPGTRKSHRALVASLARRIRDDVSCRLPGGDHAAMTSDAIRHESRVVHAGSSERCRTLVASLAGRTGDDVI